jgi:hypothetical protein
MISAIGFVDIDRKETVITLRLNHHDQMHVVNVLSEMLSAIPGSTKVMMDGAGSGGGFADALEHRTPPRVRVRRA